MTPGDYPLISSETYKRMLDMDGDIVIPKYEGIKGHPVLIRNRIINELFTNSIYSNLKEFINSHDFTTVDIEDSGILMDIDTPDDYNNIMSRLCGIHSQLYS